MRQLTSIEICAGAGGQALGLEQAGFNHLVLIENDHHACNTLRTNRPSWNILEMDIKNFSAKEYYGIDLLAGGIPCPPFSKAGQQLGENDERNLFPEVIRLVKECHPRAIMIENVPGLLDKVFNDYRAFVIRELESIGYRGFWRILNASDYGVPQLRPRAILVAFKQELADGFTWPCPLPIPAPTVGEVLYYEMSKFGWEGADEWRRLANRIAPTLVGGSKKHGGPDLGPTRAKKAWAELGVDGNSIADEPPSYDYKGMPRLTVRMTAILQGFPNNWIITGKKTPAYRQVGNAFPPPVAKAVGESISRALFKENKESERGVA